MPHSPHPLRRERSRSGLTVVEVIIALMLVSIGLLAIAGSTSLALRTTLDAAGRNAAAQRAVSRVAQLAAAGCDRAAGGADADAARQVTERWTIVAQANGFAIISDSVMWTSARGARSFSLMSAFTC